MAGGNNCVRIDEDTTRGGFVFSSTMRGNDDKIFYPYGEIHHFFERVALGYFNGVSERAQKQALLFQTNELTPLNAEYATAAAPAPETVSA